MKIYRFVPATDGYRFVESNRNARWWPTGMNLGRGTGHFSEHPSGKGPSLYEGNRYETDDKRWPELELNPSDFPPFALNVPLLSQKAYEHLHKLEGLETMIDVWVDDEKHCAISPPVLHKTVNFPKSQYLQESEGLWLYLVKRVFNEETINKHIFWTKELMPFSDVYLSEEFVRKAREAHLKGLEFLELVWDSGKPCLPRYTPSAYNPNQMTSRCALESELVISRCDCIGVVSREYGPILEKAFSEGLIAGKDELPTLEW